MSSWTPTSYQALPIKQQPDYGDKKQELDETLQKIRTLPPLVQIEEINSLRERLARCAEGSAFLLQGGDCAEIFSECKGDSIDAKLKILLQMSLVLMWGTGKEIVRVGRIAGQYAKPRSNPTEKSSTGEQIPVFKGDIINGYPESEREHRPSRLLDAYFHSAATLNYIRGRLSSGWADLHQSSKWDLNFTQKADKKEKYKEIISSLEQALRFMSAANIGSSDPNVRGVGFFTSHEGLILDYESALTKASEDGKGFYDTSAHFVWIGDRTRGLNDAHIEFFRGIENPIGIKVGPSTDPIELLNLLHKVEPQNRPGRVTLITRLGAGKVEELLPKFVSAIQAAGKSVVWSCDPMHGNTFATDTGIKTRKFEDILQELISSFAVHKAHGSHLGGVHFELTGANVTECVGGAEDLSAEDLAAGYESYCDPRLNYGQSLEMAFLVAQHLSQ